MKAQYEYIEYFLAQCYFQRFIIQIKLQTNLFWMMWKVLTLQQLQVVIFSSSTLSVVKVDLEE